MAGDAQDASAPGTAGSEHRGAAFFDLDKTLMEGSSGVQWGRAAYKAGLVSPRQLLAIVREGIRFRLEGASDEDTDRMLVMARGLLRGAEQRRVARLVPDAIAGILPRIYPEMIDEAHEHMDRGRPTLIVSAASHETVELLARVLLMSGAIGTRYEIGVDGRFTGRFNGPFIYGEGKVTAIEQYAREHHIDLAASFAYSDSTSDLPMLRAVGNPVAVNPDSDLLRIARAEGWRVMRFDPLRRRLAIGAGVAGVAVAGALGSQIFQYVTVRRLSVLGRIRSRALRR